MRKTALVIFIIFFVAACSTTLPTQVEEVNVQEIEQVDQNDSLLENAPTQIEAVKIEPTPTEINIPAEIIETLPPPQDTSGPDCYGSEPHEIGLGIAESFPETTYEQVMIWFCNGAEFEDILVALQTEKLTDFPAGEMLFMLADDWTWDEIWQVIGLIEE